MTDGPLEHDAWIHGLRAGAIAARAAASHFTKAGETALAQRMAALAEEAAEKLRRDDEPTRDFPLPHKPGENLP